MGDWAVLVKPRRRRGDFTVRNEVRPGEARDSWKLGCGIDDFASGAVFHVLFWSEKGGFWVGWTQFEFGAGQVGME